MTRHRNFIDQVKCSIIIARVSCVYWLNVLADLLCDLDKRTNNSEKANINLRGVPSGNGRFFRAASPLTFHLSNCFNVSNIDSILY